MIQRNDAGVAILKDVDLEEFMDDLFKSCKDEKEVYWLRDLIIKITECSADDRVEEF